MIIMIGFFVTLLPALISTISAVAFTPQQTLLINLFGVIILARYIDPLTILGAATIGLLAVIANFFSTLVNGTGLLLTVMIIYQIYEQIVRSGMEGASPTIKRLLGGIV